MRRSFYVGIALGLGTVVFGSLMAAPAAREASMSMVPPQVFAGAKPGKNHTDIPPNNPVWADVQKCGGNMGDTRCLGAFVKWRSGVIEQLDDCTGGCTVRTYDVHSFHMQSHDRAFVNTLAWIVFPDGYNSNPAGQQKPDWAKLDECFKQSETSCNF